MTPPVKTQTRPPILGRDTSEVMELHKPTDAVERELFEWWIHKAVEDYQATVPKMLEYGHGEEGSADLKVMGDALGELLSVPTDQNAMRQELAAWFYALGKVARLISNYKRHEQGKRDHWFDLRIYTLMAERLQEVGRWP